MKSVLLLTSLAATILVCCGVDYSGYKTYRVYPKNVDQKYLLDLLRHRPEYDFWSESTYPGRPVDIMVEPSKINFFRTLLFNNHFNSTTLINNVASVVPSPSELAFRTNFHDIPIDGSISFKEYNRYDTVTAYLRELGKKHPELVTPFNIGKTSEGRNIIGVKISTGGSNKPGILIDAGIHAREWIAPATALYIIQQLAENPSRVALLVQAVDWYIIPVLNPDGYEYTHTTDRFWRKNRSPGKKCKGVDANRNFGFHWMEVGASSSECSETYAGPKAFSEAESNLMKDFALKQKNIKLYLTFHSYGQYLLYPWGFTSEYPTNRKELQAVAESVNTAIKAVRGTTYTIGSSTNVLYPAAGGSDDWMKGVAGIPLSYTIELPGGGPQGFNPSPSSISGIVKETFEGIKVFGKYVELKYKRK